MLENQAGPTPENH